MEVGNSLVASIEILVLLVNLLLLLQNLREVLIWCLQDLSLYLWFHLPLPNSRVDQESSLISVSKMGLFSFLVKL